MGHKEELDDLIAAFGRRMQEEHPNPERVGCPRKSALRTLAANPEAIGLDSILDHVRQCAACLDELRALRQSGKRSRQ